jgi:hypothetical protein
MSIIITIGGQVWPCVAGTLNITESLGGRSTCEFTVLREDAASPPVGAEVTVGDGAYLVFAGTIDEVERFTLGGSAAVESRIRCTDYAHILDRRLAGEYCWSGQRAGDLVRTICAQSLSDEGIGLDFVQDGPVVENFAIVYPTVAEAVTRLAEIAHYYWYVDYYRQLHFFSPETYDCPFSIGDGSRNFRSLTLRLTREEYANFVVVKLAQYVRSESETFHGDGSARTFTVGYPIAAEPEITLNGAPQTVGVAGVDTGKDWYWSAGSRDIQQDSGGTLLEPSDTLVVNYQGVDQTVVAAENAAEIAARQAVEGGSGRYEILRESGDQTTRTQGEQLAAAILDRLDAIPAVAKFESDGAVEPLITAVRVGQRISIGVTGYAPAASYLIRTIRIQDLPGTQYLKYEIEAVNGPLVGDAYDFFRDLAGGGGSMMAISGDGGTPAMPDAPNVTPVTSGDNRVRIVYQPYMSTNRWGFAGSVTFHTNADDYAVSLGIDINAESDHAGVRLLGSIAAPSAGQGDVTVMWYTDLWDLPVYPTETWTLAFRAYNRDGKQTPDPPTVGSLVVEGATQAGGGGGTSSPAPNVSAAVVANQGYDATWEAILIAWLVQQPSSSLTNWRGFRIIMERSDDPGNYYDMTGLIPADRALNGQFGSGPDPIRIEKADFPTGTISCAFRIVSENAAGQPQIITSEVWNAAFTPVNSPLMISPPPGATPNFTIPPQPTAVTIAESSRTLNSTDNQTYAMVTVTPAWPGGGTDADRVAWWLSEDNGATYGFRGFVHSTGPFSFPQLVYVGGKTIKVKVLACRGVQTPNESSATASNPLAMSGHSQPAATLVSAASVGSIKFMTNADGIQRWGVEYIQWTNPSSVADPHFFHSQVCITRGTWNGSTFTPMPTSQGHEGIERPIDEAWKTGETHVCRNTTGWAIPAASSPYQDFRLRIFCYDRSHVYKGNPATDGVLQTSCWSGGSQAILTPGQGSGMIRMDRAAGDSLGAGIVVAERFYEESTPKLQIAATHKLLSNSDFALGLGGWFTGGSPAITATPGEVRSGVNAVKGTGFWHISQVFTARPGDRVYAEAWVKALAGATQTAYMAVSAEDASENWLSWILAAGVTPANASDWYKLSGSGVCPSNTAYVRFYAFLATSSPTPESGTWACDDARCEVQQQETVGQSGGYTTELLVGTHLGGDTITAGLRAKRSDGLTTDVRDWGITLTEPGGVQIGRLRALDASGDYYPELTLRRESDANFITILHPSYLSMVGGSGYGSIALMSDNLLGPGIWMWSGALGDPPAITFNDQQVLTVRQPAIANLSGGATLSDVISKVNAILAMLRTHGLIAT